MLFYFILICSFIVAARVISQKNHVLHGYTLHLAHVRKPKDEPKETDRLLISNLPPGTDDDFLILFLENVLEMEETDFSVAVLPDQLALIVFHKEYTVKGTTDLGVGFKQLCSVNQQMSTTL